MKNKNLDHMNGFTILELMITVGMLIALVGIAAPSFNSFVQRQAVRADSQFAFKALSTARMEAMVIDEAATLVCWNTTSTNINISDGTTTHVIRPRMIAAIQGSATRLGDIISSGLIDGGGGVVYDNDTNDCIGFDAQGRLTGANNSPFGLTFCRAAGDTTDALRVEVSNVGRVMSKLNTDTSGLGVQACS